jgi:acetolactate synthase-1/2/3 large subunit
MNLQELATLTQFNIHAKTIIINNGWQGMVRQWQEAFYGERYSNSNMEAGMPDVELLAQAYGIKGITIRHREELAAKIAEMLAHDGPVLVNAIVTKEENCYPMVAPGQSNARMIGLPKIVTGGCEMLDCPSCGAVNSWNNKFCPECGAKL